MNAPVKHPRSASIHADVRRLRRDEARLARLVGKMADNLNEFIHLSVTLEDRVRGLYLDLHSVKIVPLGSSRKSDEDVAQ